ncbi:unnamed protein product [Polarella glacialis]|uniref:Uncharacterized protein n=1 Tax=Polarella glacialis TaxID=89957 RepID=A0A813LHA9_POLGL|nr:unnamed protein product [Polarella glacialis]
MADSARELAPRQAAVLAAFQAFLAADSLLDSLAAFEALAEAAGASSSVMHALQELNHFKVKQLLSHLTTISENEKNGSTALEGQRIVVVGAGPGGLRSAIQARSLGAQVTVLEMRPRFTRHNVLKLWPGVVDDLLGLGLKVLQPKFGTTGSEKISIRRLQLVLLKIALLVGCKMCLEEPFRCLLPPSGERDLWRIACGVDRELECDVVVGSDGENSMVARAAGFDSSFTQFSKTIGITFNFEKSSSAEETRLKEFSRSRQFFQSWFSEVEQKTGVSLENFVYFKDETHYFVMAASYQSLIAAGILKELRKTPRELVASDNVDPLAVCRFARHMAELVGLPKGIHFAQGARGPDIGVFDFTAKRSSQASAKVLEAPSGQRLLVTLVGDAAVAPFWPLGTGANKAILGAYDACHAMVCMAKKGASRASPEQIQAALQRQYDIFVTMKQLASASGTRPNAAADPGNSGRRNKSWCLDPETRYCNIGLSMSPEMGSSLHVPVGEAMLPYPHDGEAGPDLLDVMSCENESMLGSEVMGVMLEDVIEDGDGHGPSATAAASYVVPEGILDWLAAHPHVQSTADLREAILGS